VRVRRHLSTIQVVRIILNVISTLNEIGVGGTVSQCRSSAVLNHVRRLDELSVRKTLALVRTAARASLLAVLPALAGTTVLVLAPDLAGSCPATNTAVARSGADFDGALGGLGDSGNFALGGAEGGWLETLRESGDASRRAVSDGRGLGRITVDLGEVLGSGVVAGIRTVEEVGGLVHIDPESIDVRTMLAVEEVLEEFIPVLLRVRVEPIGEDTGSSPDNSSVV
jgi:hypothetical protein